MSPILINAVLYGILIPGVVAVACVAGARPWRRDATGPLLPALAGLALCLAYAAGHRGLTGALDFWPIDISNWLPHMAALAALVGVVHAFVGERRIVHVLVTLVGATAIVWLALRPQLEFRYTGMTGLWVTLGGGVAVTAYHYSIERVLVGERARVGALFAIVIAGVAPALVALSGSLLLGQLGGVVAAAVGGLAALALVFDNAALVRALVAFASLATGAFIALAYLYASMRYQVVIVLALAPAAVFGTRALMDRIGSGQGAEDTRGSRLAWVARLAVLLAFAGLAGFLSATEETEDTSDGEYGYGYE